MAVQALSITKIKKEFGSRDGCIQKTTPSSFLKRDDLHGGNFVLATMPARCKSLLAVVQGAEKSGKSYLPLFSQNPSRRIRMGVFYLRLFRHSETFFSIRCRMVWESDISGALTNFSPVIFSYSSM